MLLMCVNLWAVLGSAVATMVIGFLWYSPMLFAKPWMVAMGYDPADKAKIAEMQKTRRAKVRHLVSGKHPVGVHPGQDHLSPHH